METGTIRPGPRNLITDVEGIRVGNAEDHDVRSGVTLVLPDHRTVAGCDVRGGAPCTRETDALDPTCIADAVDAVVLSGGSTYGLDAASSVVAWLGAHGRGFSLGASAKVSPVVPAAAIFDLANGGNKEWSESPPYRGLGRLACLGATADFALGNAGAGLGAQAGDLKGGLGSASAMTDQGLAIGALVVVNAFGSAVIPGTDRFWAAPFELDREFGGRGLPPRAGAVAALDPFAATRAQVSKTASGGHTTIGVVAVNADLTPAEARRVAIMAHDGFARALRPIHSPVDGDTVIVLATGRHALDPAQRAIGVLQLGAIAADCAARAIARGVYAAESLGQAESYRARYGA